MSPAPVSPAPVSPAPVSPAPVSPDVSNNETKRNENHVSGDTSKNFETKLNNLKTQLNKLLNSKETELSKYSDQKYSEIKNNLEQAFNNAEKVKETADYSILEQAQSKLEKSIAKATSDKETNDLSSIKTELKSLLNHKQIQLDKYQDTVDSKYTLLNIKTELETVYNTVQAVFDNQSTTLQQLVDAKTKLQEVISQADTNLNNLKELYTAVKDLLVKRFVKMFEYKYYHGINTKLFDVYNQAAVDFYNQGQKINMQKLQQIKANIDAGLTQAETSKQTANSIKSVELKEITLVNQKEIAEYRSNNNAEYAIDGNSSLSIPVFGNKDGIGAVKRNGEILFNFTKPINVKSVTLHQYVETTRFEALKDVHLYGQVEDGGWYELASYTKENENYATLASVKDYTFTVPKDKQSVKFKTLTLKSLSDTGKWWAIKDVDIIQTDDSKIFIESPIVASTQSEKSLFSYWVLSYGDKAETETEFKLNNIIDGDNNTYNKYRTSLAGSDNDPGFPLHMEFLKPINIHSIKLNQSSELKLSDLKLKLIDTNNQATDIILTNVDSVAEFIVPADSINKKFKSISIQYTNPTKVKHLWQINDIEIL
ncbi:hypothetical protein FIV53_02950 [Mycoplasma nasistruthionis]|uniref:Uncharacterized protein n=1 Tax=Mycoplasma nasistruthionis TaxID=353852 RepID=A0A4Y6I6F5_9MOLU|nr:hypothetical protein FIV53_02950 [Mycoplasma nasistruthionis]